MGWFSLFKSETDEFRFGHKSRPSKDFHLLLPIRKRTEGFHFAIIRTLTAKYQPEKIPRNPEKRSHQKGKEKKRKVEYRTMQRDRQDHGSRSSKPATIHSYAQSGDLLGFQRLLRGDPSLLNERNPVVRFH
jgi:hypothetical protein